MSGAGFLKIAKLNRASGANIIGKAARHNKRAIQVELGASITIDPARSHLNETLRGPATADDVAKLAKALMTAAGFDKPRKNAVLGLEFIFSLPPDKPIDDRKYFNDILQRLEAASGATRDSGVTSYFSSHPRMAERLRKAQPQKD